MTARLLTLLLLLAACRQQEEAWKALPLGTKADFRGVFFADARNGWVAGGGYDIAGGLIGRTADGGKTWRFKSGILSSHPTAAGHHVEAVHFFDAERGVAAADGGKVYVTSDGGENWGEVRRWMGPAFSLFDLEFHDERTGWAAGREGVLRTLDGGQTWVRQSVAGGRAIDFVDVQRGWMVDQHTKAMSTSDGGTTWIDVTLPVRDRPDLWDVYFLDERTGWIAGAESTLLQTRDGGATWIRRELGLSDPGLTLASIRFADAQHGWIVGHFQNLGRSLILRTVDGGTTWTVDADIDGEELRSLFVLDRAHVWAIGARTRPGAQAIYFRDPSAK